MGWCFFMRIWKFLAIILSFFIFVNIISLTAVLIKLNFASFLQDNKFIVQVIFFVGGAYIVGAFYRYLKGTDDDGVESQIGHFVLTRNKLIAIGIVVLIPIVSILYLLYF